MPERRRLMPTQARLSAAVYIAVLHILTMGGTRQSMAPAFTTGWVYNLSKAPESSNASSIIAIALTFSILSCLACALRIYCRSRILRAVGADDAAVLLSFVVGTAYCANAIVRT